MIYTTSDVRLREVPSPVRATLKVPAGISDETYRARAARTRAAMAQAGLDALVIYADREHGANFGFLCGYEPRFEEALLILKQDHSYTILGNENLRMAKYSRIETTPLLVPALSLPNQPMVGLSLDEALAQAGLSAGCRCGLIGWKLLRSPTNQYETRKFDLPHFIVEAVANACGWENTVNAAPMFLDPARGVRTVASPDEIANYEYAATVASHCILDAMDNLEAGQTEMEIADHLNAFGMPLSCYSMCATGERFSGAMVYPRDKAVRRGDRFNVSMGLRGGMISRSAFAAFSAEDLPEGKRDWLDRVARPYFAASATWYSSIRIGMTGDELYRAINEAFPRDTYGWTLNPGHLLSTEEWLCSPVYPGSQARLKSGMMLQMDIIPSVPGFDGVNAEDGIVLADQALREQLRADYPGLWERICRRRAYMEQVLGIPLHEEVLPTSDTTGYCRPYLLNKTHALVIGR